ncbi:phosphotransferase [Tenggerimyces flavus]|uniref:Phosphotransferase family protein n=1 Tax=Tenggerimyces flavus TaxID=1708749 RepID=A0ABV7YB93_9ACTN|nr:phosphotransferase [Tenggerimyces flavus]MBM7787090.1 aminoglycoside phosphotransferase (APT) family kinase protein [Tenggerimyces flavus]
MEPSVLRRAVDAAATTAAELGLDVSDAVAVHNSDRIAVRLDPCDVLARVAPGAWHDGMAYEAEVARRLAATDSPIGGLDPRAPDVYDRDGFAITFWTYYEPVVADHDGPAPEQLGWTSGLAPAEYVDALVRLHTGLRQIELDAPHVTERVDGWTALVDDRERTPDLPERDRALLKDTLTAGIAKAGTAEQLLHGEPHPGNVLNTSTGPRFIDLGTCQRGPIEYDLAYLPEEVAELYPGADLDLVHQFRILTWAGVAAMRWNRDDQYPDRDRWRVDLLDQLRAGLAR